MMRYKANMDQDRKMKIVLNQQRNFTLEVR